MPVSDLIILFNKILFIESRHCKKKGDNIRSPEIKEELIPINLDVATVLEFALSFFNYSFFYSFFSLSNSFILSIP